MNNDIERTSPLADINGMVAELLDDVADRPAPCRVKSRLAEIRQAVAGEKATIDMALEIIDFSPTRKAPEHFAAPNGRQKTIAEFRLKVKR